MQWKYHNHEYRLDVGNVPEVSRTSFIVDARCPFPSYTKMGILVSPSLEKDGGQSLQQEKNGHGGILDFYASNRGLDSKTAKALKARLVRNAFPPPEDIAVPAIKEGINISALFAEEGWMVFQAVFYDSHADKAYRLSKRWTPTETSVAHEVIDPPSASRIIYHRDQFLSTKGLPEKERGLVNLLLSHL